MIKMATPKNDKNEQEDLSEGTLPPKIPKRPKK